MYFSRVFLFLVCMLLFWEWHTDNPLSVRCLLSSDLVYFIVENNTVQQSSCHTDVIDDLYVFIYADYESENWIFLSPTYFLVTHELEYLGFRLEYEGEVDCCLILLCFVRCMPLLALLVQFFHTTYMPTFICQLLTNEWKHVSCIWWNLQQPSKFTCKLVVITINQWCQLVPTYVGHLTTKLLSIYLYFLTAPP